MSKGHSTSQPPAIDRQPVPGVCTRCGEKDLRRYPVNSEGGWFQVVKCQACLFSVSRERWSRLGPVQLLSDLL